MKLFKYRVRFRGFFVLLGGKMKKTMNTIVNHAKANGFVFQGSEIYGGLANSWDYGPLGVEFKNNLKKAWWLRFIQQNQYNVGIDSSIIMNPRVWEASGHLGGFSDPLMDCKACKTRHRADKIIEEFSSDIIADGWTNEAMEAYIQENNIVCPNCGKLDYTSIRQFNLMFKTHQGVIQSESSAVYLRPETAQGIFVNYKNVQRSRRLRVPFGIGQIGKSFRNEITPGNFIFRTREFEQMELEFFCHPSEDEQWYKYWQETCMKFLTDLGVSSTNLQLREHEADELSHYSKGTSDIEYKFPFGVSELWGVARRTDFDLKAHMDASKQDLQYVDPKTNEKYIPFCIEPAVGVDRLLLALYMEAYDVEDIGENDQREVLHLHPFLAPIKAAILPLQKQQNEQAQKLAEMLSKHFAVELDESGKIGKRYRRQDAIGTPLCITIDFETENDKCVTIRDRDTMEQKRVLIDNLVTYIENKIQF